METFVLVMEGKNESVDYVSIKAFTNKTEASDFVNRTNLTYSAAKKYWTYTEIVVYGGRVELTRPEV